MAVASPGADVRGEPSPGVDAARPRPARSAVANVRTCMSPLCPWQMKSLPAAAVCAPQQTKRRSTQQAAATKTQRRQELDRNVAKCAGQRALGGITRAPVGAGVDASSTRHKKGRTSTVCGGGEPSPSADVGGVSPVQVQMWQGRTCERHEHERQECSDRQRDRLRHPPVRNFDPMCHRVPMRGWQGQASSCAYVARVSVVRLLGDVPACDPQHNTHHSPRWRASADDRAQPDYRWGEDRSPRPPHSHLQSGCQPEIYYAADTAAERGRLHSP